MTHLTGAIQGALKERRGLLLEGSPASDISNATDETYHVAYPIEIAGKIHGVVALEVVRHSRHEVQAMLRQLHWGAAWLEVMLQRKEALKSGEIIERFQQVFDAVTSAVEHDEFYAAGMGFVTKLATIFECDRVSLGFLSRGHVKAAVLSHSAIFGKQTNLMSAIGAAMDEALDQNGILVYPVPAEVDSFVTRAHEDLARQHGSGAILTIPLEHKGKLFGGLTLDRPEDKPFSQFTVEACESIAALAGPILKTMQSEDRWIIIKMRDSLVKQFEKLVGPGHLFPKLIVPALLLVTVFFALFKVEYKVKAPTQIEGAVQRVVAAPFNSYVKESPVRPGDVVREGDVLCLLEHRDLKLERLRYATEKEQLTKQFQEAMATHNLSEYQINKAKIEQAEAQIGLLDEQLSRTKILAPFRGIVMSGDLSQSLGSPVERGDVLFDVAPLDEYRVIVNVDERDISEIEVGQEGQLLLPSMSGEKFPFVISKITPVLTAQEGSNYFRVEGRMSETSEKLRPGMEGVGKIRIDRRRLIWVWTHKMVDWLRLQLWRWMP
jgi:multidrug resistance efflux pump